MMLSYQQPDLECGPLGWSLPLRLSYQMRVARGPQTCSPATLMWRDIVATLLSLLGCHRHDIWQSLL